MNSFGKIFAVAAAVLFVSSPVLIAVIKGKSKNQDLSGFTGKPASRENPNLRILPPVAAMIVGLAGSAAFLYFYWTSSSTAGMGVSLGLAFGGFGIGLILWLHRLIAAEEAIGKREPLRSRYEDRQGLDEEFQNGTALIGRRKLLGMMAGSVAALLSLGLISLVRSLGNPPLIELRASAWQRDMRLVTYDGKPVAAADMQRGDIKTVFPEGRIDSTVSEVVLLRIDPETLKLPAGREGWTPDGLIAYSKTCTHAGCPVAQYERERNILLCPCHQSSFDILTGAAPIGGPAGRPLPQLPLYVDSSGYLRAAGDFSSRPGPGYWRYQS